MRGLLRTNKRALVVEPKWVFCVRSAPTWRKFMFSTGPDDRQARYAGYYDAWRYKAERIFSLLDTNKHGVIDCDEIAKFFKKCNMSDDQIRETIETYNTTFDPVFYKAEFLEMTKKVRELMEADAENAAEEIAKEHIAEKLRKAQDTPRVF